MTTPREPGPLPTFDAVLFDMDGTLVDTEHLWFEAGRALMLDLGIDLPDGNRRPPTRDRVQLAAAHRRGHPRAPRVGPRPRTIEDVPSGKPSPASYQRAAQRLGVAPAGCLVLEDSRVGARAAVAAGATCIWVTFGAIDPAEARRVTPWVANDLREALARVDGA